MNGLRGLRNGTGRLVAGLAALVLLTVAVVLVAMHSGDQPIDGRPEAMPQPGPQPGTSESAWTLLRNPASGLSYQVPPSTWTPQANDGTDGPVVLRNGARRTAYTCAGNGQEYLRGELGSGTAPAADPGQVATALAYTAASQFYATAGKGPQITIGAAQPVHRNTPSGRSVTGAVVKAIATQSVDPCLASRGEVLVLVLPLAGQDAVLMINGDLAGGPKIPAPPPETELQRILDSAAPITG